MDLMAIISVLLIILSVPVSPLHLDPVKTVNCNTICNITVTYNYCNYICTVISQS